MDYNLKIDIMKIIRLIIAGIFIVMGFLAFSQSPGNFSTLRVTDLTGNMKANGTSLVTADTILLKADTVRADAELFVRDSTLLEIINANAPSTAPAGVSGELQFNNGGVFGANGAFRVSGDSLLIGNLNLRENIIQNKTQSIIIRNSSNSTDMTLDAARKLRLDFANNFTAGTAELDIISGATTIARFESGGLFQLYNTTNQLRLGTTNTTTITSPAPSASRTYTIPDAGEASNFALTAAGVANRIPYWSSTTRLTNSSALTFDGTQLALTGASTNISINSIGNIFTDGATFVIEGTSAPLELAGSSVTLLGAPINLTPSTNGNLVTTITGSGSSTITKSGSGNALVINDTGSGSGLVVTNSGGGVALQAGNISVDGNTIASTNTNGNIILEANGTASILGRATGTTSVGIIMERATLNDNITITAGARTTSDPQRFGQIGVRKNASIDPAGFILLSEEDAGVQYIWVDNNGIVRISTAPGNIGTTTGTAIGDQTSDERLKDFSTFNYGLSEILQLEPKRFTYTYDVDSVQRLGFSAQQAIQFIPEAVYNSGDPVNGDTVNTKLVMDYSTIIPVLVKAIQELEARVKELEGN